MKRELVVATHNEHKLTEICSILGSSFSILSLSDLSLNQEIEETGITLEQNAKIKSEHIYNSTGKNVMSDDSGLEIDVLGGSPGVFSARFGGPQKDDGDNIKKVLLMLKGEIDRRAKFRTVISLFWNGKHYFFKGSVAGHITGKPLGSNGFGYDPIFLPINQTKTFAEMTSQEKNSLSHRSQALFELKKFLFKMKD